MAEPSIYTHAFCGVNFATTPLLPPCFPRKISTLAPGKRSAVVVVVVRKLTMAVGIGIAISSLITHKVSVYNLLRALYFSDRHASSAQPETTALTPPVSINRARNRPTTIRMHHRFINYGPTTSRASGSGSGSCTCRPDVHLRHHASRSERQTPRHELCHRTEVLQDRDGAPRNGTTQGLRLFLYFVA